MSELEKKGFVDAAELGRLYRSSFGLQGRGLGGEGESLFRGGFSYSKACGSGQTDGRPVHPFVSLRRQGLILESNYENRKGGSGVDWRIMGRVDSMRCGLSPENLQG